MRSMLVWRASFENEKTVKVGHAAIQLVVHSEFATLRQLKVRAPVRATVTVILRVALTVTLTVRVRVRVRERV